MAIYLHQQGDSQNAFSLSLSLHAVLSLKMLRSLDKWRTEEVWGLKKLQWTNSMWKLWNWKNKNLTLHLDLLLIVCCSLKSHQKWCQNGGCQEDIVKAWKKGKKAEVVRQEDAAVWWIYDCKFENCGLNCCQYVRRRSEERSSSHL